MLSAFNALELKPQERRSKSDRKMVRLQNKHTVKFTGCFQYKLNNSKEALGNHRWVNA